MPVDPGFYQDLTGWPYGLLIVLEDRPNSDDASVVHQVTGARHDALALEEIARTAARCQIGIMVREHAGVLALAALVGVLARVNHAPPAGELVRELAAHG
jgi:hypothetical protein